MLSTALTNIANVASVKIMLRAYIRPEPRYSDAKQRPSILAAGVPESVIYVEALRKRHDGFPIRDAFMAALRASDKDVVVVSDLHRLASTGEDLREVIKVVKAKKATILEARTGRRSDDPVVFSDMIFDAVEFYRGRGLTHAEAVKLGKLGATFSPVAREPEGRMPKKLALPIWNDEALTTDQALVKINSDQAFDRKYSQRAAYRILGKRDVTAGRPAKDKQANLAMQRKKDRLSMGAVYFIRADGRGPVKIGFTTDIDGRLKSLATSHHGELKVIAAIEGSHADEQALHKQFEKYKVRREWFRVEGAVKKYLATLPAFEEV